jgi:hypothetical protein
VVRIDDSWGEALGPLSGRCAELPPPRRTLAATPPRSRTAIFTGQTEIYIAGVLRAADAPIQAFPCKRPLILRICSLICLRLPANTLRVTSIERSMLSRAN